MISRLTGKSRLALVYGVTRYTVDQSQSEKSSDLAIVLLGGLCWFISKSRRWNGLALILYIEVNGKYSQHPMSEQSVGGIPEI